MGIPAEVGLEKTACALRPGRDLAPTEPSTRSVEAPMISAIKDAIALRDIHYIFLSYNGCNWAES